MLHHELTVPVGRLHHSGKLKVHVPVRKIVHCRTHDLQQSLMCKLGRATQSFQAAEGPLLVRNVREESPFDVVSTLLGVLHFPSSYHSTHKVVLRFKSTEPLFTSSTYPASLVKVDREV